MTSTGRSERWLEDLRDALATTAVLVARGRGAFDSDPAVPLACEALCNRVGNLAKKLVAADPRRFSHPIWSQAARTRDFVVHHYQRIDLDTLWLTVSVSLPELADRLDA